ncbi:MAG TPA: D-glucuronyl C5-epimerase family protein [Thermoleophilaceae bacterium]|nr:D-glucuronyl C5-epimerase family protein [Thermoleophilaceae bacterium]
MLLAGAVALVLLLTAPPALAGDSVLVVRGDQIVEQWDPYLEPDHDLVTPDPPPPGATPAASGGVKKLLARARRKGKISERQHERFTRIYDEARAVYSDRDIGRRCRTQLGRVLGILNSIAQRGSLKPSRMPALFLQLERNTEFWQQEPDVGLGERVMFGRDPLLLQHYAGYGLQIQPLGNFGKANGLWRECKERPDDCRPKRLRLLLESMLRVASRRAGGKAWEYWFPFGGGYPPWASGMAQATGMQALARGAAFFDEPRYLKAAGKALPLFLEPPPTGVRVRSKRGNHYLLYSFDPRLRILNGFLQAVTGLHDYARASDDRRARRLWRAGDRRARREVPRYDTGNWSYYALPNKNLSTWSYHVLVTEFLQNLCERLGARVYCKTARRFNRYSERRGGPPPPGPPARGRRCGYL